MEKDIHNRDLSLASPISFSNSPEATALPPVRVNSVAAQKQCAKRRRSAQPSSSLPVVFSDVDEHAQNEKDNAEASEAPDAEHTDSVEETALTPPTRNCSNSSTANARCPSAAVAAAMASPFSASYSAFKIVSNDGDIASTSGAAPMSAATAAATDNAYASEQHPRKRAKVGDTLCFDAPSSYDMEDLQISDPSLTCMPNALQMSVRTCAATCLGYLRKINQDVYICDDLMFNASAQVEHGAQNALVLGVADGHGVLGHVAALLCKREIPLLLQKNITKGLPVHLALRAALASAHSHICEDAEKIGAIASTALKAITRPDKSIAYVNHSLRGADYGTTLSLCIVTRKMLYIANVGDSRCMVVKRSLAYSTTELQTVFITEEHNCSISSEKVRVQQNGGALEVSGSEFRIYPNTMSCREARSHGLSMNLSRALGHIIMNKHGISAEPALHTVELDNNCEYVVIVGSDGLFVSE
jgi:serine/threonine protein phosphatase PrpC